MKKTRKGIVPSLISRIAVDTIPFRAYIAASRRSDRSLEARLESARRASEIHKRRTGKALRVTEADVQNEEMYEEEDDLPASFHYGLGSSSFELRMRMQAYWEQQLALRNAMSFAAAGGNLNAAPPPLSLRDYYQRFAQQYPLSLTSNQYLFQSSQLPLQQYTPVAPTQTTVNVTSPSMSSSHSHSPVASKSPVSAPNRRTSAPAAPYSVQNSQRNRRASSIAQNIEQKKSPVQQRQTIVPEKAVTPNFSSEYIKSPPVENIYTTQPFQSPIHPFTTQLPIHMQQYNLADFMDPITVPTIPAQSIPLDQLTTEADPADFFSNSNEWQDFVAQSNDLPSKITPYEDSTNWDDYLDGDANWLYGSQHEADS